MQVSTIFIISVCNITALEIALVSDISRCNSRCCSSPLKPFMALDWLTQRTIFSQFFLLLEQHRVSCWSRGLVQQTFKGPSNCYSISTIQTGSAGWHTSGLLSQGLSAGRYQVTCLLCCSLSPLEYSPSREKDALTLLAFQKALKIWLCVPGPCAQVCEEPRSLVMLWLR